MDGWEKGQRYQIAKRVDDVQMDYWVDQYADGSLDEQVNGLAGGTWRRSDKKINGQMC